MKEHGKILRQGDLILVTHTKHHRRMFLFENTILLAKKRKCKHHVHEVASSERFDFKQAFKVWWEDGEEWGQCETEQQTILL